MSRASTRARRTSARVSVVSVRRRALLAPAPPSTEHRRSPRAMEPDDKDPPAPGDGPPERDDGAPEGPADAPVEDLLAGPPPGIPPSRVTGAELRAFLGTKRTVRRLTRFVRKRLGGNVPDHVVEEIVSDAFARALAARARPRSADTMFGWLRGVTRHALADYFEKRTAEREHLVDPAEGVDWEAIAGDEAGERELELDEWLTRAVRRNERDQETLELLFYKAERGKTDDEVARDHGMTATAWRVRVHRFRAKYAPRWGRRDLGMLTLLILGGASVAVALVWWIVTRSAPPAPPKATPVVVVDAGGVTDAPAEASSEPPAPTDVAAPPVRPGPQKPEDDKKGP